MTVTPPRQSPGTLTNGWRLARRRIMGAETRQPDDATRH